MSEYSEHSGYFPGSPGQTPVPPSIPNRPRGAAQQNPDASPRDRLAAAEAALGEVRRMCDAADESGTREPYYAWVRVSDLRAALPTERDEPRPRRYDQCDDTCTADCGHCKGRAVPGSADTASDEGLRGEAQQAFLNAADLAETYDTGREAAAALRSLADIAVRGISAALSAEADRGGER